MEYTREPGHETTAVYNVLTIQGMYIVYLPVREHNALCSILSLTTVFLQSDAKLFHHIFSAATI